MKKILNSFKNVFLTGLFVALPIAVTIFVIIWFFKLVDSLLGDLLANVFNVYIPGLGILTTIALIFAIGLLTSNVIGKKLTHYVEGLLLKIPIIKTIYSPAKDIMKNFSGKSSSSFRKVVLVEFPSEGMNSIGFVTKEYMQVKGKTMHAVFIPTTPNPTNGFLIYVEPHKYQDLYIPVDDALKTIISLGSISPDIFK